MVFQVAKREIQRQRVDQNDISWMLLLILHLESRAKKLTCHYDQFYIPPATLPSLDFYFQKPTTLVLFHENFARWPLAGQTKAMLQDIQYLPELINSHFLVVCSVYSHTSTINSSLHKKTNFTKKLMLDGFAAWASNLC